MGNKLESGSVFSSTKPRVYRINFISNGIYIYIESGSFIKKTRDTDKKKRIQQQTCGLKWVEATCGKLSMKNRVHHRGLNEEFWIGTCRMNKNSMVLPSMDLMGNGGIF